MTDQRRFFACPRLWGLLCGVTLAVAQFFTPLGGMGTAQAATLTVTSIADSGAGSLRQAIANAAPGDTITFALPNPSTITLSSELVIAKNLTISGPGAAALTISGNNATRVFFINPGAAGAISGPPATALTVQISGLTIANGKAQGGAGGAQRRAGGSGGAAGMGGALFSNHGNLTISGVVFDANQAQGGNSAGGGVSFFGGSGGGGVGGNGGAAPASLAGGVGGGGGALGGNGGTGGASGIFLPDGSNGGAGAAGGEGAGGGGGGIGDDCPGSPCTGPGANGGNGGNGGFGGGAGGGGASGKDTSGSAAGGSGGAGGFGGGGGGGGSSQNFFGPAGAGGAGGAFGGNGGTSADFSGGSGGGGAGLGGAIFVRAGSLTLVDSSFSNNSAAGGSGAQNGQGKGGALFILSPATLNVSDCINVSGNSATNAAGSAGDTNDFYGSVAQPCDTTGPVANPTLSPAPNAAGWNNTNVTVNWNWSDDPSGIVNGSCETSSTSNLGVGTQTLTAFCVDEAGNQSQASYTVKVDRAAPLIQATVSPPTSSGSWAKQALTVSFTCQEQGALSGIATNTVGGNQTFSTEGTNFTATNTGTCVDFADNVATAVTAGPFKIDLTKPTISAAATTQPNANGWYNSNVTVRFTCADNLSGIVTCPADQALSSEGPAVSSTAQTVSDRALNSSDASNIVTVKIDKTAPSVLLTGVTEGATYNFGSVPAAACSTTDALSGVAMQATLNVTGGNGDGSGSFTATCNGTTDLAGNSAAPVSVSYTVISPPTNTPVPPTATPTNTPVPPTDTPTNTPVPPTDTPTNTPVQPTDTPTNTPVPPTDMPTATPPPAGDACTATALRDDFNRADGSLGGNWAGLNDPRFFQLAANGVDVQLGGPVVWKPTTFGVNQAAFVTLRTLDAGSLAQGLLLKVQTGTIPNAGAIAVVYDNVAKAVRVSTLRLNSLVWTAYPNTPATFNNGDKLAGCVQADGAVRVYQNSTLLTTVTLSAADQQFFNTKGGKIGLWAISAPNAVFDEFGGGAVALVTSAAVSAGTLPDEVADDGAALVVDSVLITASVPVSDAAVIDPPPAAPVDATAPTTPDSSGQNQRLFLPLISNLAGAALGSPGAVAGVVVVILVVGGFTWQRRRARRHR